ncbi:MAG: RNB domain-containing ribonuclease [Opitutaceae bacterium]|jgi:ribonuclease R|nr:RNB domain-containing ribonuclease [Opitutaceae bacterium]
MKKTHRHRPQGKQPSRKKSPASPPAATPPKKRPVFIPKKSTGTAEAAPAPFSKRQPAARQPAAPFPKKSSAPAARNPNASALTGTIHFRQNGNATVIPLRAPNAPASPDDAPLDLFSEDTANALPGDTVEVALTRRRSTRDPNRRMARVIRVLQRASSTAVGTLQLHARHLSVRPDDPRFPRDIAVTLPANIPAEPGDKVVVTLDLANWNSSNRPLRGTVTERLGKTFEPAAELLGLCRKYNLNPAFPEPVRRQAAALPAEVTPADTANRLDCRHLPTITIDPDDAKDFDDALSIEQLPGNLTRVAIHIADVSHYVTPGSPLDIEARARGNSTYLVGAVIPMLPEKLSNGLCSLVEARDRLAKTVFLTFRPDASIAASSIAATVIRSRKRLTYRQAHALLTTDDLARIRALPLPAKHNTGSTGRALSSLSDDELRRLAQTVRALWKIASKLRARRFANGSLDLDMPETRIILDEQGRAARLEKITNDESHQLVEEFMLAANEAVARLTRSKHIPSLYRVHDAPDPERLLELRAGLAAHDIQTGDLSHRPQMTRLLQTIANNPDAHILRTQVLRSLKKACYRATPDGHYGLSKKDYTHFTSPIRRYADLIVHRVLPMTAPPAAPSPSEPCGNLSPLPPATTCRPQSPAAKPVRYAPSELAQLAEHISRTEIASTDAERESVKIKLAEYFELQLAKQPPPTFPAVITDATPRGLFIELTDSLAFGFIPASALPRDAYFLNHNGALTGRRLRNTYAPGQKLAVQIAAVDRARRQLDFRPARA